MDLKGRRVLITGATGTNASAIIERLVEEGAKVVGFSRRMPVGQVEAVNKLGDGTFWWLKTDTANREQVDQNVAKAAELMGGIDAVICTAFIYWEKELIDLTREDFETLFDVTFYGYVNVNQAAFPYLKESKGTVLNFASGAGVTTKTVGSDPAHYCAAKAATIIWTKKLAIEWGQYGINANAFNPLVWSNSWDNSMNTPEIREWINMRVRDNLFEPDIFLSKSPAKEIIAPYVCFLVSDEARYITGQVLNCDGGMVESR
ncbi:MAG: SDR family oxidoreductase [Mogibacterium sp.]|nr:SDR family oxidoreductase [Mogibacterium sp.]MBR3330359.1 SDR family oxidoreductase [Mogibacterium sp.]